MNHLLEACVPGMKVDGLVITRAGDDVLVYDQATQALHTLNATVNEVWQLCDSVQTVHSIVAATGHNAEVVRQALSQLEDADLLESSLARSQRASGSRRSFMKKAGIVAIPAIVSVSVPMARAAASDCSSKITASDCFQGGAQHENKPCCWSDGRPGRCLAIAPGHFGCLVG